MRRSRRRLTAQPVAGRDRELPSAVAAQESGIVELWSGGRRRPCVTSRRRGSSRRAGRAPLPGQLPRSPRDRRGVDGAFAAAGSAPRASGRDRPGSGVGGRSGVRPAFVGAELVLPWPLRGGGAASRAGRARAGPRGGASDRACRPRCAWGPALRAGPLKEALAAFRQTERMTPCCWRGRDHRPAGDGSCRCRRGWARTAPARAALDELALRSDDCAIRANRHCADPPGGGRPGAGC